MILHPLLRSILTFGLVLLVSLGGVSVARASMPLAVAPAAQAGSEARQALEDSYRAFKQQWERNNLTIKEQIEASAREARQAFGDITRTSQDNPVQALRSLGDWATGVSRGSEKAGDDPAARLQRNLELGQRSVRDLSRQFDAFQSEVNRSTRTLPKELRDRFQGDALVVERSIGRAAASLEALLSDAKDSVKDASDDLRARVAEDLRTLDGALEEATKMVTAFFQVA
jgi:paraquat-inducible protein B